MAGGGGAAGDRGRRSTPLDTGPAPMHTRTMGDQPAFRRRVLIEDTRHDGSYLRTTWHAERRAFVVSIWRDEVCTGAVRVPVAAAGELARLLIDGLADAATSPAPTGPTARTRGRADVLARARAWLHRLRLTA
jgi:hypothetical protein